MATVAPPDTSPLRSHLDGRMTESSTSLQRRSVQKGFHESLHWSLGLQGAVESAELDYSQHQWTLINLVTSVAIRPVR